MLKGGYEFKTSSRELMEVHSGKLNIKIAGDKDWTLRTVSKLHTRALIFNV